MTMLGETEKSLELFNMINPIEHSKTQEKALVYKVEPYVLAADVYGEGSLLGRGGWTWYTGSSSWFYKAGIENILGLNIKHEVLSIKPCIPKNWNEYKIRYEYGTSIYNIIVRNISHLGTNDVKTFKVNGEKIEDKKIKLIDNGKINEIEILL